MGYYVDGIYYPYSSYPPYPTWTITYPCGICSTKDARIAELERQVADMKVSLDAAQRETASYQRYRDAAERKFAALRGVLETLYS